MKLQKTFNQPFLVFGTIATVFVLGYQIPAKAFTIGINSVINGPTTPLPAKADSSKPYLTLDFSDGSINNTVVLKLTANFASVGANSGGYIDHLTFNTSRNLRIAPVAWAFLPGSGVLPNSPYFDFVNRNNSFDNVAGYGSTYKDDWDFRINFPNANAKRLKGTLSSTFVLVGFGLTANQFNVSYPNGVMPTAAAHIKGYGDSAAFGDYENSTPVPEPITLIGSGIALGFGAFLKRKAKQTH